MSGPVRTPAFGDPASDRHSRAKAVEFRLTYTDERFVWAGETTPGLPLLRWPDGTVCEPALLFFGYSAEVGRVATSSMRQEAYTLREWLAFLWARGSRWDGATDQLLRDWRENQRGPAVVKDVEPGSSPPARRPSDRQVERKLATVFEFYRVMPEAICLDEQFCIPRPFVGPAGTGSRCPITSRQAMGSMFSGRSMGLCWAGARRGGKRHVRRVTPTTENVARILAHVRSKAASTPTGRRTKSAEAQSRLESERNWLAARCEIEAGLRAEEVAGLSPGMLAKALAEEGVAGQALRLLESPDALGELSRDAAARNDILTGLDTLAARGRHILGVEVSCKGKTRKAPFPVELVRDLLDVGIWTVRDAQVCSWRHGKPGYVAPLRVFLSSKTGAAMKPGTIGDIMKEAFDAVGVLGSGHRLRAFFGISLALRLLQERLALNGFCYDSEVESWVLEHVADALGHSGVGTTTRHYVDTALMRLLGCPSKTKLAAMLRVHRALLAQATSLGQLGLKLVREVIEALSADRRLGVVEDHIRSALPATAGADRA